MLIVDTSHFQGIFKGENAVLGPRISDGLFRNLLI